MARPRNVLSRLRDDGVNAPLRFWLTETRHGGYEPDQVSTIIRLKTTMTRGCKQNSSRFRAWIIHIFHTLWATLTAEKAIEIVGNNVFTCDRRRRSGRGWRD